METSRKPEAHQQSSPLPNGSPSTEPAIDLPVSNCTPVLPHGIASFPQTIPGQRSHPKLSPYFVPNLCPSTQFHTFRGLQAQGTRILGNSAACNRFLEDDVTKFAVPPLSETLSLDDRIDPDDRVSGHFDLQGASSFHQLSEDFSAVDFFDALKVFYPSILSTITISQQKSNNRENPNAITHLKRQLSRLEDIVEVLQASVSALDSASGTFHNNAITFGNSLHLIPAINCNKIFNSHQQLRGHLQSATGTGHRALPPMIKPTDCQLRAHEFNKTQVLPTRETPMHRDRLENGFREQLDRQFPPHALSESCHLTEVFRDCGAGRQLHKHWTAAFSSSINNIGPHAVQNLNPFYAAVYDEGYKRRPLLAITTKPNERKGVDSMPEEQDVSAIINDTSDFEYIDKRYSRQPYDHTSTPPSLSPQGFDTLNEAKSDDNLALSTPKPQPKLLRSHSSAPEDEKAPAAPPPIPPYLTAAPPLPRLLRPTPHPTASTSIAEMPKIRPQPNAFDVEAFHAADFCTQEYDEQDYQDYYSEYLEDCLILKQKSLPRRDVRWDFLDSIVDDLSEVFTLNGLVDGREDWERL
ncbi:MAG: hypothetical protein Q9213_000692 [Squamulea squamosa]